MKNILLILSLFLVSYYSAKSQCTILADIYTPSNVLCEGDDTDILITISGGVVGDYIVEYDFTPASTGVPVSNTTLFTGDVTQVELTNVNESGTVTLKGIDDSDCGIDFDQDIIITVYPLPEAELTGGASICNKDNAILNVNITKPTQVPYQVSYVGNPGGTLIGENLSVEVAAVEAGTYCLVDIVDGNGCVGNIVGDCQIVDVLPTFYVSNPSYSCDKFTGTYTAEFEIGGGTPPYSINGEQNGNTIQNADGIFTSNPIVVHPSGLGNYSFTVSDASGCTDNTSVPVYGVYNCNEDCAITGTLSSDNLDICESENSVEFSVNLSGAVNPPYAIEITAPNGDIINKSGLNEGDNTITISNLQAGVYTLTKVNDGDCVGSSSGSVILGIYALPTGMIYGGGAICDDNISTSTVSIALTGQPAYSLTYSDGNAEHTVAATTNQYSFEVNSSGAATYKVIALTDGNGCVASSTGITGSATVSKIPLPDVSFTGSTTICDNGIDEAILTITGVQGVGEWNGVFKKPGGTVASFLTTNGTYSFETMEEGEYIIESVVDQTTGCVNTSDESVVVNKMLLPVVSSIQGQQSVCPAFSSAETYVAVLDPESGRASGFEWQVQGPILSGRGTKTILTEFTGISGLQTISVTPQGCSNGTTVSMDIFVEYELNPYVIITDPGILCQNGGVETFTAEISSTGGQGFIAEWFLNDTPLNANASEVSLINYSGGDILKIEVTTSYTCSSMPTAVDQIELDVIECGGGLGLFSEVNKPQFISTFPNPSTGIFHLESEKSGQVQVYDSRGDLVFDQPFHVSSNSIDISSKNQGVYFLKCTYDDGTSESMKLIKQ